MEKTPREPFRGAPRLRPSSWRYRPHAGGLRLLAAPGDHREASQGRYAPDPGRKTRAHSQPCGYGDVYNGDDFRKRLTPSFVMPEKADIQKFVNIQDSCLGGNKGKRR